VSVERMILDDDRVLEYAVSGGSSRPLLVLHLGSPCAVTEFPHVSAAADRWNLRTAICSRPGYGASSRHPGRTVSDAAHDTGQLADHLGVETFVVAGWSGGGPAALACAALLGTRVRACVTLAGMAPIAESADQWRAWYPAQEHAEILALMTGSPEELADEYEQAAAPFRELTADTLIEWPQNTESDAAALRAAPAAAESLAASMRLGVSDGVWGWLDDSLAWARPWGFSVEDVSAPVVVRHGDRDRIVSVEHARWLAQHLPNVRFQELAGGGHTSVATPFEPVVEAALAAASEGSAG
jgi:pimeloyl-ACP methyl ester carboxylesterase